MTQLQMMLVLLLILLLIIKLTYWNFKQKLKTWTGDDDTIEPEIVVPLKCVSNFSRSLEMLL